MRPTKKQQIVDTAIGLFCEHGYQATGIDKVIEAAGIAKMTLYSHFKSKEELILECLRELDRQAYDWLVEHIDASARDARGRILKIFDVVHEFVSTRAFYGCPFMRASSEYADLKHQIHQQALEHKRKLHDYFEKLAKEAGVKSPRKFATKLQILMEGTFAMIQLTGDDSLTKAASETVRTLLEASD